MARGCAAQLAVCAQGGKVQQRERTSWAHLCLHETTTRSPWSPTSPSGLSPLARGNRPRKVCGPARWGPIPARTGQPRLRPRCSGAPGAYPRSHGATFCASSSSVFSWGLSPLARGNRAVAVWRAHGVGPIPARTGQPRAACTRSEPCRAYPRSHGATWAVVGAGAAAWGLSPLARGNQDVDAFGAHLEGPIPARTGQPSHEFSSTLLGWAYPRSHGATPSGGFFVPSIGGLSPLARGNRRRRHFFGHAHGPIPARTGQPPLAQHERIRKGAYPRSHGATCSDKDLPIPPYGLSPLARGNHIAAINDIAQAGPIPARTGQPGREGGVKSTQGAYPRSHGATSWQVSDLLLSQGLSPLARGNRTASDAQIALKGPIPARTGQP